MSSTSALNSLLSSSSSASAIDLSAILEAATGSSSEGIDVTAAVNAAVSAAEAPEDTWVSQQETLQSQSTALTQLQTDATNLDNDMQSLNSLTGPLAASTVTSSNASIVTASAAAGSATGNELVVVNSLATTASYASSAVANAATNLPAESITIAPASGSATTITTGSGVNTLTDLENAINTAGLGVTASIITDASGSRLAITSNTSGSAGSFTVSSTGGSFGFTQAEAGGNASITVNGIGVSSASNTVTGVLPGVTLNLQSASPGTEVTLAVTPDASQASTAINQFVTDYNTLITAVNTQFTDTAGSGQGVLAEDPTVQSLQSELLGALGYTATSGSAVTSLASMGISVNTNGTLSVDSGALNSALTNNFSTVQNFFQGSALNGFANSLDQQLTSFISPADGAFTLDLQSIGTQNTSLQDDINNFQSNVIAPLKTQLQAEYSQAEIALQQLPDELKNIDAELGMNNSQNG
jgi:flagellar hook-associated protein 2